MLLLGYDEGTDISVQNVRIVNRLIASDFRRNAELKIYDVGELVEAHRYLENIWEAGDINLITNPSFSEWIDLKDINRLTHMSFKSSLVRICHPFPMLVRGLIELV